MIDWLSERFVHPQVLLALPIPVLMLVGVWGFTRFFPRRRLALPFDHGHASRGRRWALILNIAESLPALLLAIAVVILAVPKRYGAPESKRSLTNIEFCVDISGSMTAKFGDGTRYDAAMAEVVRFVDHRKGDAFGLTFFGDNYLHWCPLTTDPSAIKCSLPFMRPEIAPPAFGGTAIAKALQGCRKILEGRDQGEKMILLITDGFSFDLQEAADDLLKELNKDKISVFTIIIGAGIQEEIATISRGTGGEAFETNDPEALKSIFKKIDSMKQAKITKTIAEPMDDFRPWCLAGLILIGVALLCSLGLRYVPW